MYNVKLINCFLYKRKKYIENVKYDLSNIPIFIISYNNLFYLKQIIESLEFFGLKNIHIIDNHSDYSPLLEYLDASSYHVHRMKKNWGHKVLWLSHEFDKIINSSVYVVTDPDIEISKRMPKDFIYDLYTVLEQFPFITKVGLALRIDDIPFSTISHRVIEWEKKFWKYKIFDNKYELYKADLDTTFAIYRPGKINNYVFYNAIRIAGAYTARHLPWYLNSPDQEHYIKTANPEISSWLTVQKNMDNNTGKD